MWYAVWVQTGREDRMLELCKMLFQNSDVCDDYFLPKYERAKKVDGQWTNIQTLLFPGYLFLVSDKPEELQTQLKSVPEFAKVLGDDDGPIPLYDEEVKFLENCMNKEKVVEMSTGYIEGDSLMITDGPMKDYKGKVIKIDRHKRVATLEVNFFGGTTEVNVGLEVVRKI